jgi:hypothetical protein
MATPPTFTAGSILTAAQMNSVGMWLVASGTIGTAVSTVAVANCFTGDYDAYKIVVSGGAASADSFMKMVLGASTTGYYQARNGVLYSTGARSDGADNNAAAWTAVGTSLTTGLDAEITLINVNYAKWTVLKGFYTTGSAGTDVVGVHQVNTAYTGFTIYPNSGTWTGGYYRVYGYRV